MAQSSTFCLYMCVCIKLKTAPLGLIKTLKYYNITNLLTHLFSVSIPVLFTADSNEGVCLRGLSRSIRSCISCVPLINSLLCHATLNTSPHLC